MTSRGHHGLLLAAGDGLSAASLFKSINYTGDNTFPRALSAVDLSTDGLILTKERTSVTRTGVIAIRNSGGTLVNRALGSSPAVAASTDALTSTGCTLQTGSIFNVNGTGYVSHAFKPAARFMDIVRYTGNGANRTIAHSLGAAPGLMVILNLDNASFEAPYAYLAPRGNTRRMQFFGAGADVVDATAWNNTSPTSATFSLGTSTNVNGSGKSYAAVLFADDTAADGVIRCGSYTGNGSTTGPIVTLGWQPQFLLIKDVGVSIGWAQFDTTRTPGFTGNDALSRVGESVAETTTRDYIDLTADGFQVKYPSDQYVNFNEDTYFYLAIRKP